MMSFCFQRRWNLCKLLVVCVALFGGVFYQIDAVYCPDVSLSQISLATSVSKSKWYFICHSEASWWPPCRYPTSLVPVMVDIMSNMYGITPESHSNSVVVLIKVDRCRWNAGDEKFSTFWKMLSLKFSLFFYCQVYLDLVGVWDIFECCVNQSSTSACRPSGFLFQKDVCQCKKSNHGSQAISLRTFTWFTHCAKSEVKQLLWLTNKHLESW